MINKTLLLGNVGKDPEIKTTSTGKKVATFSLATSEKYGDNTITQWHNIVVWEKLAEICEKYVKKGSQLFIEGKISYREWRDKDGNKKYITEIVASEIKMLGKPGESKNPETNNEPQQAGSESDDLPFN